MILKTSISKAQRKTISTGGTLKITTLRLMNKWREREFFTFAIMSQPVQSEILYTSTV